MKRRHNQKKNVMPVTHSATAYYLLARTVLRQKDIQNVVTILVNCDCSSKSLFKQIGLETMRNYLYKKQKEKNIMQSRYECFRDDNQATRDFFCSLTDEYIKIILASD